MLHLGGADIDIRTLSIFLGDAKPNINSCSKLTSAPTMLLSLLYHPSETDHPGTSASVDRDA